MRILADENIPDELIDLLREKGHDVTEPPSGSSDPEVAAIARRERRLLISQDKDFGNVLWYPPKHLHGIVRLKFHPPVLSEMLSALDDLFQKFSQSKLNRKLIILEKDGFRIRE